MNKIGHIFFGLFFTCILLAILYYFEFAFFKVNFINSLILIIIIVFYSLLPDLDHKISTMTWWFLSVGILGLMISVVQLLFNINIIPNTIGLLIYSTLILATAIIIPISFNHRGPIHGLVFGLLSVSPLYFVFQNLFYPVVAFMSFYSHLLADGYIFKLK